MRRSVRAGMLTADLLVAMDRRSDDPAITVGSVTRCDGRRSG